MIQIGLDQSTFVPVCRMDKLMAYLAWPGSNQLVTDVWVNGNRLWSLGTYRPLTWSGLWPRSENALVA